MESHQPTKKRKKYFRCPNCGLRYPTNRSLTTHLNTCSVQVESATNVAPENFTAKEFDIEIKNGNVNPHQFHTGQPYRMLIRNAGPISEQQRPEIKQEQQDLQVNTNPDTIAGLQHIGAGEANDDEHSTFSTSEIDFYGVNDDDMNLSDHFEEESPLPSMYKDISIMYEKMKRLIAPEEKKPKSRKECKNQMSLTGVALSHLMMLVNKHMGSKELYDDLLEFIFEWTKKDPNIFTQRPGMPKWNRKRVVTELEHEYDAFDLKSVKHHVDLHDGRVATVPVVDAAAEFRDMLDDPFIHKHVSKGVCRETFRLLRPTHLNDNNPESIIGEKEDGYLYQQAIDLHCPSPPDVDPKKVRPLLLTLHIDKTTVCNFGLLSGTPIQASFSMLNADGQYDVRCWRVLAYIPNLSAGKSKDDKDSKQSEHNRNDYQKVLRKALSSLRDYCQEGGIWWIDGNGEHVLLKPIIFMILGDSVGGNELVGQYNVYTAQCLAKDCRCKQSQIVQWPLKCRWPLAREL